MRRKYPEIRFCFERPVGGAETRCLCQDASAGRAAAARAAAAAASRIAGRPETLRRSGRRRSNVFHFLLKLFSA